MADKVLFAKRINNGQSEIWIETQPQAKRVVATNGVLYPIRTICPKEESDAFHKAFNEGATAIPAELTERLASDFGLDLR